jgi:hypothetical protein
MSHILASRLRSRFDADGFVRWDGDPGLKPWVRVGFRARRDRMIVARQFIAWTAYKNSRVPEGRLIRGGRQIESNTSMNLTAFQPSPGRSSLLRLPRHFMPGYYHSVPTGEIRQPPGLNCVAPSGRVVTIQNSTVNRNVTAQALPRLELAPGVGM